MTRTNRSNRATESPPLESAALVKVIEEQKKLSNEILEHYRLMRAKSQFIEVLQRYVQQTTEHAIAESQKENMPTNRTI
ncbi:hypothetical protein ACQ4LE_008877 [Meloidogyne hapla]|uniref:Uncharacterized protein n=1 Tax=Meloidogyne hapla TaxID=6305 RepID=A0A1I8BA31_MELHA